LSSSGTAVALLVKRPRSYAGPAEPVKQKY
jgi:hypothetical protein